MKIANENGGRWPALVVSVEEAVGPNVRIDAEIVKLFRWVGEGAGGGMADPETEVSVDLEGEFGAEVHFVKYGLHTTTSVPRFTSSVAEVFAMVENFLPHLEWEVSGGQHRRSSAVISPDVETGVPEMKTFRKSGPTPAIALLRAFFHAIGIEGVEESIREASYARAPAQPADAHAREDGGAA